MKFKHLNPEIETCPHCESAPRHIYLPEKLNFWDRIFNRYKKFPIEKGCESWHSTYDFGYIVPKSTYSRDFVIYHKIDRLTGAYEILKKYLN